MTDRRRCAGRPLEEVVNRAIDGGVNVVQIREKDLPAGQLLELAVELRAITRDRALLFVNDRVDVALACGADGVQLGEEGLSPASARSAGAGRLLIGRSVHDVEGAEGADAEGADLLLAGAVFPTASHRDRDPSGICLLEKIGRRVRAPYLAIGGVNEGNVGRVMEAGAAGAAVITAITLSTDPTSAARRMMSIIRSGWTAGAAGHPAGPA